MTLATPAAPEADEHPMNVPIEWAPKRPPGYHCNGRKSSEGLFLGYCQARAGRGTDHVGRGRCKHHGGAADNRGTKNGNYRTGAYSERFREQLTEVELAAIGDVVDTLPAPDDGGGIAAECAAEALMKYKRAGDPRFLREARQWLSEFNLIPSEDAVGLSDRGKALVEVAPHP